MVNFPPQCQAITWINIDLLLIEPRVTILSEILIKKAFSHKENIFQNVCKLSAIFIQAWLHCNGCSVLDQWVRDVILGAFLYGWIPALVSVKSLISPGQNGRHVADDIFKCIFMNEKFWIWIWFFLKFVPKGPIENKWALVQVMAWYQTGDKPLPEVILTQFTDAYQGKWVNSSRLSDP